MDRVLVGACSTTPRSTTQIGRLRGMAQPVILGFNLSPPRLRAFVDLMASTNGATTTAESSGKYAWSAEAKDAQAQIALKMTNSPTRTPIACSTILTHCSNLVVVVLSQCALTWFLSQSLMLLILRSTWLTLKRLHGVFWSRCTSAPRRSTTTNKIGECMRSKLFLM